MLENCAPETRIILLISITPNKINKKEKKFSKKKATINYKKPGFLMTTEPIQVLLRVNYSCSLLAWSPLIF